MNDTLNDGDRILINEFSDIERYDVIVFEAKEDYYCIKRVYGLPGETVQILDDGTILINGEAIEDKYATEVLEDPGIAAQEITLSDNEYFVLGDNRNNSLDSRSELIGLVDEDSILGIASLRFYPFNSFGLVKNIE